MKANLLALFVVLISATPLTATAEHHPNHAAYPDNAAHNPEPAALLKQGISKLTTFLKSRGAQDRGNTRAFLESEIAPYFDFGYMTRWAAGPAWRGIEPEQRAMLQERLEASFMMALAQKLTTYTNQPIRYFTPRGQSRNDVSVSAWIMQPNGPPIRMEFRFYKSEGGWKIFDVKAAGSSAVVYYRNQFRHMFRYSNQHPPYN